MKDLPIWARWNGQEVLAIVRGREGRHTYYLRKRARGAPLPHLTDALLRGLGYALARLVLWCGKPWRRLRALRVERA